MSHMSAIFNKNHLSTKNATFWFEPHLNSPVSQYERPRAVALASSACVDKTTNIITEFTRKDPFFTSEMSELSTAKGIIMK